MDRFRKLLQPAHGRSAMKRSTLAIVPALAAVALLAACNQSAPDIDQYGANPELPDQHPGLLPNMPIPRPARWGDRVPTVPEGYSIRAIPPDLGIPRTPLGLPHAHILVAHAPGANPELPDQHRGLLPNMTIARPARWGDRVPTVPEGYSIRAIATDLGIPRQTLVLPNGDILVAEGRGGNAGKLKPKDVVAGYIKAKGNTSVKSGNRLTLLRDGDGDGSYELKTVFADKLNAPYGLALVGNTLYVANQDALVKFDYTAGQTKASGAPVKVVDLPSRINHHWTKSLAASEDGRFLYVGIGSNSNITERGMNAEVDRAVVWQIDPQTGMHRTYASGLRNPTALAVQPGTGVLWAVVNERD